MLVAIGCSARDLVHAAITQTKCFGNVVPPNATIEFYVKLIRIDQPLNP